MKKIISFLLLISFITPTYALIRYVKPIASGTGDGSSWANASGNLQAMIDIAIPAQDEVWVAAGKYFPTSIPSGCTTCGTASLTNRNNTFLLKSGLRIYGGFAGTETARANRNSHLNESILSGDIGTKYETNDNVYHVVTAIDCNNSTVLERFTIEAGNANGSTSVTVAGRTYYRSWGGGVLCVYSPIRIALCAIVDNQATDGGGILNTACNPYITNSVFANNTATAGGGGIYNHEGSAADIRNCTIIQNTANVAGGAMYNYNSIPYIINVIVWYNTSPSFSGIANNGSGVTGYSSNLEQGWGANGITCSNCLNANPQFINIDFPAGIDGKWGSRDDGLRVTSCSPGIDKGTNGSTEGVDMANQIREIDIPSIDNTIPSISLDMGAYEYQNTGPSNTILYVNGSLTTGLNDGSSWENAFRGANAFGTALRYANHCDNNSILVAKGTYKPHRLPYGVTSGSNRNYTFALKGGLKIYGGFLGTESILDYSTRKAHQNETILSGDFADDDVVTGEGGTLAIANNTENAYHVLTIEARATQIVLKGLTIKGGNAIGASSQSGGGINAYMSTSFEITDCNIKHNSGTNGAGVYFYLSSPLVFNNNYFDRNLATTNGGAIYIGESSVTFRNNVFSGNRASMGVGGAVRNDLSFGQFYNNTFYKNSAQTSGGALFTYDPGIAGAPIDINRSYNNIFYKNAIGTNTTTTYADFFIERNGRDFRNNILQFAAGQYPLNNTSNGIGATAVNNLFAINPLFVSETNLLGPDLIGGSSDDGLRLQSTSPAVNTGIYSSAPSFDILGNGRYSFFDIGAYEFHPKEACPDNRYIADVPIEAGTHFAGTQGSFTSSVPEPAKNQRVGAAEATMAVGDGHITAVGTVASATSVVFDASKSITLLPGFQTQTGATFRTNLQGCPFFEESSIASPTQK
ncbi:right-handed parallel beta-helix repeat-containing protein [Runella salmonicolor]|uniref:Right handed beta helix region n=1 Tax=Runella salmonicolor TaxID=2950278 RepID=A0ABT1FJS8_9BACT|nr:right-handed parallel beta-helix repeat-containing protein [Runella salmonicolor]MCP1381972.1 hypothetical protein [Runella salmonicolor]